MEHAIEVIHDSLELTEVDRNINEDKPLSNPTKVINICPITGIKTATIGTSIKGLITRLPTPFLMLSIEELNNIYYTDLDNALHGMSYYESERNTIKLLFHGYLQQSNLIDPRYSTDVRKFNEDHIFNSIDLIKDLSNELVRNPSYLKHIPRLNPSKVILSVYLNLARTALDNAKATYKEQLAIKNSSSKISRNLTSDELLDLTYTQIELVSRSETKLNLGELKYSQNFKETRETQEFNFPKGLSLNLLNAITATVSNKELKDFYLELLTKTVRQLVIKEEVKPVDFEDLLSFAEDWHTNINTKLNLLKWLGQKFKVFNKMYEDNKIIPIAKRATKVKDKVTTTADEVRDFMMLDLGSSEAFIPSSSSTESYINTVTTSTLQLVANPISDLLPVDFNDLVGSSGTGSIGTKPNVNSNVQKLLAQIKAKALNSNTKGS